MENVGIQLDISQALNAALSVSKGSDHTFYWKADAAKSKHKRIRQYLKRLSIIKSKMEESITLNASYNGASIEERVHLICNDDKLYNLTGQKPPKLFPDLGDTRGNLCSSYRGKLLSGTFRGAKCEPKFQAKYPLVAHSINPDYNTSWRYVENCKNLIDNELLAKFILNNVKYKPPESFPSGLILFAGSTKSGKSEVARSVALEIIQSKIRAYLEKGPDIYSKYKLFINERLPHLVTYEDPIEEWCIYDIDTSQYSAFIKPKRINLLDIDEIIPSIQHGFCFTPRQKGIDVLSLADALADAKRQTPTCFYIGEVRKKKDWQEVLEFAGSGHLVVATTHASSLVEMISRILSATNTKTPSERRMACSQLLACVHLELNSIDNSGLVLSPSIWLRNGKTVSSMVADGLSSIIADGKNIMNRSQVFQRLYDIKYHNTTSIQFNHVFKRLLDLDAQGLG